MLAAVTMSNAELASSSAAEGGPRAGGLLLAGSRFPREGWVIMLQKCGVSTL